MELTKDEAIRLHRELWGWLAENPRKTKSEWPRWEYNGGDICLVFANCFACEVSDRCDNCLFVWPGGRTCEGLYEKILHGNIKKRVIFAKQIRDLPVREVNNTAP